MFFSILYGSFKKLWSHATFVLRLLRRRLVAASPRRCHSVAFAEHLDSHSTPLPGEVVILSIFTRPNHAKLSGPISIWQSKNTLGVLPGPEMPSSPPSTKLAHAPDNPFSDWGVVIITFVRVAAHGFLDSPPPWEAGPLRKVKPVFDLNQESNQESFAHHMGIYSYIPTNYSPPKYLQYQVLIWHWDRRYFNFFEGHMPCVARICIPGIGSRVSDEGRK